MTTDQRPWDKSHVKRTETATMTNSKTPRTDAAVKVHRYDVDDGTYERQLEYVLPEDMAKLELELASAAAVTGKMMSEYAQMREELSTKESDRQYHMNAINRLAKFLAFWGTSDNVVKAAMDNMTRLTRELSAMRPFYEKHALGPKAAPSCLMCGQSTQGKEIGIHHMELPEVVICADCAALRRERESAQPAPAVPADMDALALRIKGEVDAMPGLMICDATTGHAVRRGEKWFIEFARRLLAAAQEPKA